MTASCSPWVLPKAGLYLGAPTVEAFCKNVKNCLLSHLHTERELSELDTSLRRASRLDKPNKQNGTLSFRVRGPFFTTRDQITEAPLQRGKSACTLEVSMSGCQAYLRKLQGMSVRLRINGTKCKKVAQAPPVTQFSEKAAKAPGRHVADPGCHGCLPV